MSERLPPHSMVAEASVLGCILANPAEALPAAIRRIRAPEWFYDLRHRKLWDTLVAMHAGGATIDTVTVQQRLKDGGNLEAVGGWPFVSALADTIPSEGVIGTYLDILAEKAAARHLIQACTSAVLGVYDFEGAVEQHWNRLEVELTGARAAWRNPEVKPDRVLRPKEIAEDVYNLWFGKQETSEQGLKLPWEFPFRVRESELSFLIGEKGMGKSTLLSYIMLHLASQGWPVFVASMETKPADTLSIMMMQLIGTNKLLKEADGTPTKESFRLYNRTLDWLQKWVRIYNFVGIADWRQLLQVMEWLADHEGTKGFLVDSVMRLGIEDDNYAEQGLAAKTFANFCLAKRAHVFLVNHMNKSDRDPRGRSRGSMQWVDNSHNVFSVHRNEKKWEQLEKALEKAAVVKGTAEYEKLVDAARKAVRAGWDSNFIMHNQRFPWAENQNAACKLWFCPESRQLRKKVEEPEAVFHLGLWEKREKRREKENA